jgi:excisionase family DNA binding protein
MKPQSTEAAMHDSLAMLSTAQVCDLLQVDRKKLTRLVAEHGLPRIKIGSSNRYLLRDIVGWVEAHRVMPSALPDRTEGITNADRQEIAARLTSGSAKGGRVA